MTKDTFVQGAWNAICQRCGGKFKSTELRLTWQGWRVCEKDWEARHPQDFVRGRADAMSVPWARPEAAPNFVDFTERPPFVECGPDPGPSAPGWISLFGSEGSVETAKVGEGGGNFHYLTQINTNHASWIALIADDVHGVPTSFVPDFTALVLASPIHNMGLAYTSNTVHELPNVGWGNTWGEVCISPTWTLFTDDYPTWSADNQKDYIAFSFASWAWVVPDGGDLSTSFIISAASTTDWVPTGSHSLVLSDSFMDSLKAYGLDIWTTALIWSAP